MVEKEKRLNKGFRIFLITFLFLFMFILVSGNVSGALWDSNHCSTSNPCPVGEGDCDGNDECQVGLICAQDVGANYGVYELMDVCEETETPFCGDGSCNGDEDCSSCESDCGTCGSSDCHTTSLWTASYCTELCPCGVGEGDCDSDSECEAGLTCVQDVGDNYGVYPLMDVCEGTVAPFCGDGNCDTSENCSTCESDCGVCAPYCGDGSCNGAETCTDCPGDCGTCAPFCGDGTCDTSENCSTCENDCGVCPPVCNDTCSSLGYECNFHDVCGVSTDCGDCSSYGVDYVCNAFGICEYQAPVCNDTCSSLGYECGTHNICNISTDCGTCTGGDTCNFGVCVSPPGNTSSIIFDHTDTLNFEEIPLYWIEQAKDNLHIAYAHTSHGSQIVSGMDAIQGYNSNYSHSLTGGTGVLHLEDYWGDFPFGTCADLSQCDGDIDGPISDFLDDPGNQDINVMMWSWCDIAGHNITEYLSDMQALILEYENGSVNHPTPVKFVFMTAHANGGGEGDSSDVPNNEIRNFINTDPFCNSHECILFDFSDIENYDPDGNYFLDQNLLDNLDYDGGNWAVEYLARNPGSREETLTNSVGTCSHSNPPMDARLNCVLKGEAAWNMWARLAGWDGTFGNVSCGDGICNGDENCTTCESDCGTCQPSCGDGVCNGFEDCSICEIDCGTCPIIEYCGDGLFGSGEQCDDGNTVDGDGCSSTCELESGYFCTNYYLG